MKIDISKITKVYNGKCGCMCGCNGKYSYNENTKREAWQDPVNLRSLKIIAKKVLLNPKAILEESWVFVEDRAANKMQVVYFEDRASAQAALQNG